MGKLLTLANLPQISCRKKGGIVAAGAEAGKINFPSPFSLSVCLSYSVVGMATPH